MAIATTVLLHVVYLNRPNPGEFKFFPDVFTGLTVTVELGY